jgi:membrane protease YdiL (CAAX protease family)
MTNIVHNWVIGLAGIVFIGIFYSWNYWCRGPISKWLVSILPLGRTMPLQRAVLLVRVPLYNVPAIICYLLLAIFDPALIIPFHFSLATILIGIVLGLGLIATGSMLSSFVFLEVAKRQRNPRRRAKAHEDLAAFADTGWLRGYYIFRQAFPSISYFFIAFSILGEEMGFRGIILPLLSQGFNPLIGVLVSTIAFSGIQKMNMPTWSLALIPMISAFLMGIVHSYLALTTMNMLLLLVSHYIFFLTPILLFENKKENKQYGGYS